MGTDGRQVGEVGTLLPRGCSGICQYSILKERKDHSGRFFPPLLLRSRRANTFEDTPFTDLGSLRYEVRKPVDVRLQLGDDYRVVCNPLEGTSQT